MTHLSDDDLVLHYFGEDGPRVVAAERHLRSCGQCARAYEAIAQTLRAVTPPEWVEPADDTQAIRAMIHARVRDQHSPPRVSWWTSPADSRLVALVWFVALVYPLSLQAVSASARWAQAQPALMPVTVLALMWACAGPALAVFALSRMTDRSAPAERRWLVAGALVAAISPPLLLLVSRVDVSLSLNLGSWSWYCALAVAALATLVHWPELPRVTERSLYVHQFSAAVLTIFVLAHIVNQAIAFASLPAYTAMRSVMRVMSQHPASYTLIVAAVAIQITTGAAMAMKKVRAGAVAWNAQAVSGWYLAAFLLAHVFSAFLFRQSQTSAAVAAAVDQSNLLATARSAAQLPFLLLGVATFLLHVGVYARFAAVAYLAEVSVRRLSYAGIVVGTTVVVTVGLSLCGIHLIR